GVLLGDDWLGHPDCRDPVIMLGDFNATPRTRAYRKLNARERRAPRRPAARLPAAQRAPAVGRPSLPFPPRLPALRLDHIFVSRSIEVTAAGTIRTQLARLAPDRLPPLGGPTH